MKRHFIISAITFLFCISLCACAQKTQVSDAGTPEYSSYKELDGKHIGVMLGSVQEKWTRELLPNSPIDYYNDWPSMAEAMRGHKIDGFMMPEYSYAILAPEFPDLTNTGEVVGQSLITAGFSPERRDLYDQYNAYLAGLRESGELDEIIERWTSLPMEELGSFDFESLPSTNGTLRLGYVIYIEPLSYIYNGKPSGMDLYLTYRFLETHGYGAQTDNTSLSSCLAGLSTGAYDMCSGAFTWTEERAKSVLLSDPYYVIDQYMSVRKVGVSAASGSFFNRMKESFAKNFLVEDRWKMVLEGLGITILITVLAAIFGAILGLLLYLMRTGKSRLLRSISAGYIQFMQGVPVLVLLMVLYYVVFARVGISGLAVSILGFSLSFAVSCCETFRSGIHAVDAGQREAALALGFSRPQTFFKVVFPQALSHILPVFKAQLITMMKMTSVVGYIAVEDLTKVIDIIRSRTFDALFPLVFAAVIYFLTAWALSSLVGLVECSLDPLKRKGILSDIDTSRRGMTDAFSPVSSLSTGEELILLSHVRKEYETVTPLTDVCASVKRGDVISIIGPSGTGKSTLLRLINRLESPTSGTITAFGDCVTRRGADLCALRLHVGMVFQSFNLFGHLTVIENIMLAPVELKKKNRQEAYEEAMALLERVGLAEKALCYPAELSGGQKQRIAIARALAMHPEVLLFDEPTSALDPTMVGEVLAVIRELGKAGHTMMIVSHEMKFARNVSNRVFYMDEGGIYEEGTPEEVFDSPKKDKTRAFINKLKFFTYTCENEDFDFVALSNAVNTFGHIQLMPENVLTALTHCVEELSVEGLKKAAGISYPAALLIELNESGDAACKFTYPGASVDLMDVLDELSAALVRGHSTDCTHRYENGENILTFRCTAAGNK